MGSLSTKQQQQEILGRRMTEILEQMKSGRFEEAEQQLEACLEIDFEHVDVISALKYVKFWGPRAARLETITDVMERGEYLFREWVNFLNYLRSCDYRFEGEATPVGFGFFPPLLHPTRRPYEIRLFPIPMCCFVWDDA